MKISQKVCKFSAVVVKCDISPFNDFHAMRIILLVRYESDDSRLCFGSVSVTAKLERS